MKTILKLSNLATLTVTFALYAGCAPQQTKNTATLNAESNSASSIVGGVSADENFQKQNGIVGLAMTISNGFSEGMALCTGTLIDKRVVLTAAHCLASSPGSRVISVAVYFKTDIKSVTKADIIYADKVSIHPDFLKDVDESNPKDKKAWNDIGLLRLSADAPSDIQFAKRPLKSDVVTIDNTSKLLLAGYGIASAIVNKKVKNKITGKYEIIPVTEKVNSSGLLRKVEDIPVISVTADNKEILISQKNKKGACHGDSGGPAYLKIADGSLLQVGVTSRGTNKLGNCNQNAIYTDVRGHHDWIESATLSLLK